jgi:hypothetical protein
MFCSGILGFLFVFKPSRPMVKREKNKTLGELRKKNKTEHWGTEKN